MQATYEYGARGDMPAGEAAPGIRASNKPELLAKGQIPKWDSGVLFVGDKGMLLSDYGKHVAAARRRSSRDFKRPEPSIPKSLGHYAEWIHACKTGAPTTCNFEYAGWLTEANHLGNVAYRVGKKLEWDAAKHARDQRPRGRAVPQAPAYRKGWSLG